MRAARWSKSAAARIVRCTGPAVRAQASPAVPQGRRTGHPHRRAPGEELAAWKQQHNVSHRRVRARVEHPFARMKTWKILRDCRMRGEGVHHAMLGLAHLHTLARRA
nr:transposase [Streptomyces sp. NBC_00566]